MCCTFPHHSSPGPPRGQPRRHSSHGASRPIACAARALKRSPSSTRSPEPGAVCETLKGRIALRILFGGAPAVTTCYRAVTT